MTEMLRDDEVLSFAAADHYLPSERATGNGRLSLKVLQSVINLSFWEDKIFF
ncbi:MAG TPA: hypothetical protein PLP22_11015 [Candidatus Competibacter sp.]|nr:hypothetical protein [Candidatus Competibacter sp.]HUM96071.1 hypothetical protein [Candidatus Competibacter sp.]